MRFWHKPVSTGVLAVILLLPFMPLLAMCAPQPADTMSCASDCPMMGDMESQHSGIGMKAGDSGSCCTIKSSTPVPVTVPTIVPSVGSFEPATVSVSLLAPPSGQALTPVESSPPPFFDSQARLCTFLI